MEAHHAQRFHHRNEDDRVVQVQMLFVHGVQFDDNVHHIVRGDSEVVAAAVATIEIRDALVRDHVRPHRSVERSKRSIREIAQEAHRPIMDAGHTKTMWRQHHPLWIWSIFCEDSKRSNAI